MSGSDGGKDGENGNGLHGCGIIIVFCGVCLLTSEAMQCECLLGLVFDLFVGLFYKKMRMCCDCPLPELFLLINEALGMLPTLNTQLSAAE